MSGCAPLLRCFSPLFLHEPCRGAGELRLCALRVSLMVEWERADVSLRVAAGEGACWSAGRRAWLGSDAQPCTTVDKPLSISPSVLIWEMVSTPACSPSMPS